MLEIIDVYCQPEYDPPMIAIVIAGQLPFSVTTAIYEALRVPLGLPANPCAPA